MQQLTRAAFGGTSVARHTDRVRTLSKSAISLWVLGLLALSTGCGLESHEVVRLDPICRMETPGGLFEKRVAPILADDRPKSCNQCHLAGIDLSAFVRETPCETMACLSDQGLIDLTSPEDSKILSWIDRAEPDSELITKDVIQQEHDGFLEWISYGSKCFDAQCANVKCGGDSGVPFCDVEGEPNTVYDGGMDDSCEELALEKLFRDAVYASRQRCSPCHFETQKQADPTAPRWVKQGGSCNEASLATMREVIAAGYINVKEPDQSLLLLKPLAESEGGVPHGGSDKFHDKQDPAYLNFLMWIERYAACQR